MFGKEPSFEIVSKRRFRQS